MRRRRGCRRRCGVALIAVVAVLLCAFVSIDQRLRPLVQSYGQIAARRAAMVAVHEGVQAALSVGAASYRELIVLERDEDGRILSAETDVAAINRLKSTVTSAVMKRLSAYEEQSVRIPLGSLVGGSFMTGRGPFLPIRIHTSGVVISKLEGDFCAAGINQTRHRILLHITVMMTATLPMERAAIELDTEFLVCETVLVGDVPDTVMQLDLGSESRNNFGVND